MKGAHVQCGAINHQITKRVNIIYILHFEDFKKSVSNQILTSFCKSGENNGFS